MSKKEKIIYNNALKFHGVPSLTPFKTYSEKKKRKEIYKIYQYWELKSIYTHACIHSTKKRSIQNSIFIYEFIFFILKMCTFKNIKKQISWKCHLSLLLNPYLYLSTAAAAAAAATTIGEKHILLQVALHFSFYLVLLLFS